jgi:hypothetical protein
MKKQIKVLLLSATLAVFALPIVAQVSESTAESSDAKETAKSFNDFDHYLSQHEEVREQIKANPSLLNDPGYLSKHPELQKFETEHPDFTKAVQADPNRVTRRANRQYHREKRARHKAKPEQVPAK